MANFKRKMDIIASCICPKLRPFSVRSFKPSSGSSSSAKQTHPPSNNSAERRQQAIHPQNDARWHLGLKRSIPVATAAAVVANSCKFMTFQRSGVLQSLRLLKSSGPAAFRDGNCARLLWGCMLMNMQPAELFAPFSIHLRKTVLCIFHKGTQLESFSLVRPDHKK